MGEKKHGSKSQPSKLMYESVWIVDTDVNCGFCNLCQEMAIHLFWHQNKNILEFFVTIFFFVNSEVEPVFIDIFIWHFVPQKKPGATWIFSKWPVKRATRLDCLHLNMCILSATVFQAISNLFVPTIIVVKSILHLKSTCLKSQTLSLKENHTSEDLTDGLDLL